MKVEVSLLAQRRPSASNHAKKLVGSCLQMAMRATTLQNEENGAFEGLLVTSRDEMKAF